jgi:hypothetical protein
VTSMAYRFILGVESGNVEKQPLFLIVVTHSQNGKHHLILSPTNYVPRIKGSIHNALCVVLLDRNCYWHRPPIRRVHKCHTRRLRTLRIL